MFLSEIRNFEIETKEKIAFKSHDILTLFINDQFDRYEIKQVRGTDRCVNACMDIKICKVTNLHS